MIGMMDVLHNAVGFIGSALIILAYLLLQTGKLSSEQIAYSVINLIGASCVIFSLSFNFNGSAFALEVFWVLISIVGIVRIASKRNNSSMLDDG